MRKKAKGFEMGYVVFVAVPIVCLVLVIGSFWVKNLVVKVLMLLLPSFLLALIVLVWCMIAQLAGIDGGVWVLYVNMEGLSTLLARRHGRGGTSTRICLGSTRYRQARRLP